MLTLTDCLNILCLFQVQLVSCSWEVKLTHPNDVIQEGRVVFLFFVFNRINATCFKYVVSTTFAAFGHCQRSRLFYNGL